VGGPAILPHDGVMDGAAAFPLPDDGGLSLVGNADRLDAQALQFGITKGRARDAEGAGPDFLRIVLDPAIGRIDLAEFALRTGPGAAAAVEDDRATARRALVDCQNAFFGHPAPPC